jgi:hypothetical protein
MRIHDWRFDVAFNQIIENFAKIQTLGQSYIPIDRAMNGHQHQHYRLIDCAKMA